MSWLEIIGLLCTVAGACVALALVASLLIGRFTRHHEMASLLYIVIVFWGTLAVSGVVGLAYVSYTIGASHP